MSETIIWLIMILPILPVPIGLIIFIGIQRHRQREAQQLSEFVGDSLVLVTKVKSSETDLADNVYIQSVNGQPIQRVVLSLGVAGYYLPVGEQELVVAVDYGVGRLERGKVVRHEGLKLTVHVSKGINYHLFYHVPSGKLNFEPYENPRLIKQPKSGPFF